MKKYLLAVVLVTAGLIAASAIAGSGNPPGRDPCSHGATGKECRPDPSTNGKDCDHHGKNGGVNEDHCVGATTSPTTTGQTTTAATTSATTTASETTTASTTVQTTTVRGTTTSASPPTSTVAQTVPSTSTTVAATTTSEASGGGTMITRPKPTAKPRTTRSLHRSKTKFPHVPKAKAKPNAGKPRCSRTQVAFKYRGKWHCGVPGKG